MAITVRSGRQALPNSLFVQKPDHTTVGVVADRDRRG